MASPQNDEVENTSNVGSLSIKDDSRWTDSGEFITEEYYMGLFLHAKFVPKETSKVKNVVTFQFFHHTVTAVYPNQGKI